jgi:hypothetical protein
VALMAIHLAASAVPTCTASRWSRWFGPPPSPSPGAAPSPPTRRSPSPSPWSWAPEPCCRLAPGRTG